MLPSRVLLLCAFVYVWLISVMWTTRRAVSCWIASLLAELQPAYIPFCCPIGNQLWRQKEAARLGVEIAELQAREQDAAAVGGSAAATAASVADVRRQLAELEVCVDPE